MLAAQFCVRTVSGIFLGATDQANARSRLACNSLGSAPVQSSMQLCFATKRCCLPKSILLSCKSSCGSSDGRRSSKLANDHDPDFLQAFLLVPETMFHYRMRKQGFRESTKWQTSIQLVPFSVRIKESRVDVNSVGQEFLRKFWSPTIYLKISCGGDFLLPIIVGEFVTEKLLYSMWEDDEDCPDQFQFVKNVVEKLGYEAPIFVSKQIFLKDAVRIGFGMGRVRDVKPTYDVYLDSSPEGPDSLTEELGPVRNMDRAVKEGRYNDAGSLFSDYMPFLLHYYLMSND